MPQFEKQSKAMAQPAGPGQSPNIIGNVEDEALGLKPGVDV